MTPRTLLIRTAFACLCCGHCLAQTNQTGTPVVGPVHGSLVVAGGGIRSAAIVENFIELAGGPDARFVFVPTAAGLDRYDIGSTNFLRRHGARNVMLLHTDDRAEADSTEFTAPLLQADGVWFGGGRQWRLVDAYSGTKTEQLFRKVLERGGVIGGSSAGATIQGSFLVRGDTRNNQIMIGDHEQGFGFLKDVAIDQHVLARNRHFDLLSILKQRPHLLGIGVDEDTAIVVQGDEFKVIGSSYAIVYDGQFWSREGSDLKTLPREQARFYFLRPGDQYNLKERSVIKKRQE